MRVKDDGTVTIRNIRPDIFRAPVFGLNDQMDLKSVQAGQHEVTNGEFAVAEGAPPPLTLALSAGGQSPGRSL